MNTEAIAICTVCSRKYLPQAMTMIWSLQRLSDRYSFHVYLSDLTANNCHDLATKYSDIEFLFVDQFADAQIFDNALLLNDLEFNTSLKSIALTDVLARFSRKTFYCDSDLYFLAEPLAAIAALDFSGVLLTPHQVAPLSDESDFQMSRTGVFNSGFFGVAGSIGGEVASWLAHKSRHYCLLEPEEGIFVDQKWFDLIPAIFKDVQILRDPGYNLAYWNIESRGLGENTVFLHLSGFDLNTRLEFGGLLSKFSTFRLDDNLTKQLRPYKEAYNNITAEIAAVTATIGSSVIEANFARDVPIHARRYSVKRYVFNLKQGEIFVCKRPSTNPFRYSRLFRTEPRVLKLTRWLGNCLCRLGLAALLDNLVALFRILGRRNSWMR